MAKMMMLIDPSRCTGCRGCQVACKQWNENPAVPTTFTGSYQNPPDFDGDTFCLVRFSEQPRNAPFGVYWLMTSDRCRHCDGPTCVEVMEREMYAVHESGAVVYNEKAKVKLEDVKGSCPFEIPRAKKDGRIVKCNLCVDRVADGMMPACAQTCPTSAIMWGEQTAMMDYAIKRIAELKAEKSDRFKADKIALYPLAEFDCHVRWILLDDREKHGLVGDI